MSAGVPNQSLPAITVAILALMPTKAACPERRMDQKGLKAQWLDFANRLRPVGMDIFEATPITISEQGSADIRIIGLTLLARTLSNLKAAIALTDGGFIVEAKVIARCCFENSYWVGALVKEGDKFRTVDGSARDEA
jgi:hypothetical protein